MKRHILFILILVSSFCILKSQEYGLSFLLDEPLTESATYIAKENIILDKGFSFFSNSGSQFIGLVDPKLDLSGNYIQAGQIIDPSSRDIDKNLAVGEIPMSFSVFNNGASEFSIPIEVVPGIRNIQPKLAISYSSSSNNGLLGMGATLTGISVITREGKNFYNDNTLEPVELTISDNFTLDGERIILFSGTQGGNESKYYKENNDFTLITSFDNDKDNSPEYFKVETTDGKILYYGDYKDSDAYLKSVSNDRIISWYLARVEDNQGNYIAYNYIQNLNEGKTLLSTISYTGNVVADIEPFATVEIEYQDRNDIQYTYLTGCKLTNDKLIHKITTKYNGNIYKEYIPKYFFDKYSKLNEVLVYNREGERYNSIVTGFGQKTDAVTAYASQLYDSPPLPSQYDRKRQSSDHYGDFNGDGLIDVYKIRIAGGIDLHDYLCLNLNQGNNTFSEILTKKVIDGEEDDWMEENDHIVQDLNGDGLDDIVILNEDPKWSNYTRDIRIWKSTGSNVELAYYSSAAINYKRYNYVIGDFDGDGLGEILTYKGSNNTRFYDLSQDLASATISSISFDEITSSNKQALDIDGDGKDEVIIVSAKKITAYDISSSNATKAFEMSLTDESSFYLGKFNDDNYIDFLTWDSSNGWVLYYNTDGKSFTVAGIEPQLPDIDYLDEATDDKLFLEDIDNDGITDAITCQTDTFFNTITFDIYDNNFVLAETVVKTVANINDYECKKLFDFNGDGYKDFCFRIKDEFDETNNIRIFSLYENSKHNLITKISDSKGLVTNIHYKTLVYADYTKLGDAVFPVMDYQGPINVVNGYSQKTKTGISLRSFSYYYEGMKIHLQGRGMLGFSLFKETNNINNFSTTTSYDIIQKYNSNSGKTFIHSYPSSVYGKAGNNFSLLEEQEVDIEDNDLGYYHEKLLKYSKFDYQNYIMEETSYLNYDSYGNPTNVRKEYIKEAKTSNPQTEAVHNITNTYTRYRNSNLLKSMTVTFARPDNPNVTDISRKVEFEYIKDLVTKKTSDKNTSFELIEEFNYDSVGNITQKTLKDTDNKIFRRLDYVYGPEMRFNISSANELGYERSWSYDRYTGKKLTETDIEDNITSYSYNGFGELIGIESAEGATSIEKRWYTGSEISKAYYYIKTTSRAGNYTEEYFDDASRNIHTVTRGFKGTRIHTTKGYNSSGLLGKVTGPSASAGVPGTVTKYTFDDFGRISTLTGRDVSLSYDYSTRRKVKIDDNLGNGDSYKITNSLGEIVEAHDNGGSITYKYNGLGKPTEITPPTGDVIVMEYDIKGNRTELYDPDAGHFSYEYNKLGQLTAQYNDRTNSRYDMQYDDYGRMIQKTNSQDGTTTYTYNESGNGLGKIHSVSNSQVTNIYEYNSNGRITGLSETIEGNQYTYNYTYDQYGRLSQMQYPGGYVINYVYETNGPDLLGIRDADNNKIWRVESKNVYDKTEYITYGNGLITHHSYDENDRLHEISTQTATGTKKQYLEFDIDHVSGNLNQRTNHLAGSGLTEYFTYDNLDRLLTWQIESLDPDSVSYVGDGSGNFRKKTDIGLYQYNQIRNAGPHAVTDIIESDGAGTGMNDYDISYTQFNKISQIAGDEYTMDIIYGIDNQRKVCSLSKSGAPWKKKIYAGDLYEKETDNEGNERHLYYIPGSEGIAAIYEVEGSIGNMHYIHKDHLGSFHTVTGESGETEERYSFDAWGKRRNPDTWGYNNVTETPLFDRGYTGHEYLKEFNLINMNGRMYDPVTAVFLSPDPYIQAPASTQNFNRYSYAFGNPLKFTDNSGYWTLDVDQNPWQPPGGMGRPATDAFSGSYSYSNSSNYSCSYNSTSSGVTGKAEKRLPSLNEYIRTQEQGYKMHVFEIEDGIVFYDDETGDVWIYLYIDEVVCVGTKGGGDGSGDGGTSPGGETGTTGDSGPPPNGYAVGDWPDIEGGVYTITNPMGDKMVNDLERRLYYLVNRKSFKERGISYRQYANWASPYAKPQKHFYDGYEEVALEYYRDHPLNTPNTPGFTNYYKDGVSAAWWARWYDIKTNGDVDYVYWNYVYPDSVPPPDR